MKKGSRKYSTNILCWTSTKCVDCLCTLQMQDSSNRILKGFLQSCCAKRPSATVSKGAITKVSCIRAKVRFCDSPRRKVRRHEVNALCQSSPIVRSASRRSNRLQQILFATTICTRGCVFHAGTPTIYFCPNEMQLHWLLAREKWKINESTACSHVRQRESVNRRAPQEREQN